jgi:hypothetical protein
MNKGLQRVAGNYRGGVSYELVEEGKGIGSWGVWCTNVLEFVVSPACETVDWMSGK